MNWLWIFAISGLVFRGVIAICSWHANHRLQQLERMTYWHSHFCRAYKEMVNHEIPENLLNSMAFWNDLVADKKGAFKLAASLRQTRKVKISQASVGRLRSIDDLEIMFLNFAIAAIMTISYRHVMFGWFIRAEVSDMIAEQEPRQIILFSNSSAERINARPMAYAV